MVALLLDEFSALTRLFKQAFSGEKGGSALNLRNAVMYYIKKCQSDSPDALELHIFSKEGNVDINSLSINVFKHFLF